MYRFLKLDDVQKEIREHAQQYAKSQSSTPVKADDGQPVLRAKTIVSAGLVPLVDSHPYHPSQLVKK
jgi:hypothetical protein